MKDFLLSLLLDMLWEDKNVLPIWLGLLHTKDPHFMSGQMYKFDAFKVAYQFDDATFCRDADPFCWFPENNFSVSICNL